MSCPSGIYVVNTDPVVLTAGGTVPLNTIVRRYGSAVSSLNSGVQLRKAGYYKVDANVTFAPTALGPVSLILYKDGIPVPGAVVSDVSAAGNDAPLNLTAMIRQGCCDTPGVLTLEVSAAGTLDNAGLVVTKL